MTEVQVSLESGPGLERRLRVQVPAMRIEQEFEARLLTAGRTTRLKGFRPGKVPVHVIRQRFGSQIRREVLQDVVQSSYSEAIVREKLRPAGSPQIQTEAAESGRDLAYTAVFEVYPEIRVAGLESLAADQPQPEITDADVDLTVERLRQQKGSWRPVERAGLTGDRLVVDFNGTLGGQPLEGGKAEKVGIVIGEGRMLADFESNLAGLAPGGQRTFPVTFPADYHEEKLRGREASFDVVVREVAERELPVIDAEFVRGYGIASGDVSEFRDQIRQNLEREAAAKARAEIRRQLLEQLLTANPVDVPAVMVTREAMTLQAEGMRNLGIKDPEDAPALSIYEDAARRRVRLGLIMSALIREKDLKLDQASVSQKLDELCRPYEQPDEVRRLYLQNPELMAQIENTVMEEQVTAWLLEQARLRPKTMTLAELMGA